MTTTNELTTGPQKPAPRDPSRLYSPAENRAWEAANDAYWNAVSAAKREAQRKKEADAAFVNRPMDADAYYAHAVERENQNRARELERQAAAFAKEQEQAAFMASTPETVNVMETNPAEMMRKVEHWLAKSYVVDYGTPILCLPPSLFTITLKRGAKPAKASTKAVAA